MQKEHVLEYSRPEVDGNTIRAVKIVGLKSKNGRVYSPAVLKEAMPLYEASPVFILHGNAREIRQGHRQLRDHFGSLENVRGNGQGLFADLKIRTSHPLAKQILESALTARFGLSHDVVVDMNDDKTNVLRILQVNSVDLVDNPGTTTNLFEEAAMSEKTEFQEEVRAFMVKMSAHIKAHEATKEPVLESAPPNTPPKRLTALEKKSDEEGNETIGNDHDSFLTHLRGFSVK